MHRRTLVVSLVLTALLSSSTLLAAKATVTVRNLSDWDIHEMYLSPVDSRDWGPDQLENDILESGEEFTLYGIPCDDYDIMLVDEDGDECILENVGLCRDDSVWKLTNKELGICQGW